MSMLEGTVKISKTCRMCGKTKFFDISESQYLDLKEGKKHIQNILPEYKPCDREILISGFCGDCFEKIFADNDE